MVAALARKSSSPRSVLAFALVSLEDRQNRPNAYSSKPSVTLPCYRRPRRLQPGCRRKSRRPSEAMISPPDAPCRRPDLSRNGSAWIVCAIGSNRRAGVTVSEVTWSPGVAFAGPGP